MSPQGKSGRDKASAGVWAPRKTVEPALDEDKSSSRCLLSHDLLDELGQLGRGGPAADLTAQDGVRTAPDSEQDSLRTTVGCAALTPALSATPCGSPPLNPSWDWKTDVPEFVPGDFSTMTAFPGMALLPPSVCNTGGDECQGFEGTFDDFEKALLSSIWGNVACMDQLDGGEEGGDLGSLAAGATALPEDAIGPAPGLEEEPVSPKTKEEEEEELRRIKARMAELQQVREDVKREWEREQRGLLEELERCARVLDRYAIPLEEAAQISGAAEEEYVPMFPEVSGLLQNYFNQQMAEQVAAAAAAAADEGAPGLGGAGSAGEQGRYVGAMADPAVSKMAEDLEALTESAIDDRALRALQALSPADALEVFRKVDDLVQQQGGKCRNLSSILQSVCRKRERRSARSGGGASGEAEAAPGLLLPCEAAPGLPMPDGPPVPVSFLAPPPGLEGYSPTAGDGAGAEAEAGSPARAPAADAGEDGVVGEADEERPGSGQADTELWDAQRVARVAQRGFELKQCGDRWELKLSMASLDPPLSEQGMELYCGWLRARLAAFRKEHGVQALRRCGGELDFSGNGLGNQAVWMLLETLAKSEVQAASLKLYKNNISLGGVLALCEFIRANRCAGPVHEMHLSHNDIDDEAALELLRTLHEQRPRYPPRRPVEGQSADTVKPVLAPVPVWVRLNQNRISDPAATLKTLEAEGIAYCAARNAQSCGPAKCARSDCPLVHLYLFTDQAPSRKGEAGGGDAQPPASPPQPPAAAPAPKESRNKHRVWAPVQVPRQEASPEAGASGDEEAEGAGARRKRSRRARQPEA